MSDIPPATPAQPPAPSAPTQAPPAPPGPPGQPPPPASEPAGDDPTDWKAEARKWETRAKENSDAAARLKELEDANKTELEKLNERAAAAETRAAQLELSNTRAEVAMAKGLTASQAKRLVGATREELEADADQLLVDLGQPQGQQPPAATPPAGQQTPVEHLRPGALPHTPQPSLAEQVAAAEAKGDYRTSRQLKSQQLMELHAQQRKTQ